MKQTANHSSKSKKISRGVYLYKGLYISVTEGTTSSVWNIYEDIYCIDEYAIGFHTKKDAIIFIDNINK
jgi:hypothetical protein